MSYDRINLDGSITRVKGTYNVKKNRAVIANTYVINDRIRAERKRKTQEGLQDRAERIASYFRKINDNKSADIRDYIPHD